MSWTRRLRKRHVEGSCVGAMMSFGLEMALTRRSRIAMHRRDRLPQQHGKKFVACSYPPEASFVHEDDLVDQGKQVGSVIDDHDRYAVLPERLDRICECAV